MNLTIHRGADEIGGTCVEIRCKDTRIIIDIGIPLEENGEKFEMRKYRRLSDPELVKAKVLPDVAGLYRWDARSKPIDAVLISHAHLDHYGFMSYVNPAIPVYTSKGCKELMGCSYYFGQSAFNPHDVLVKPSWKSFPVKDLSITPHLVDHSAADAFAYEIEGDGKKLFYSGDFRGHGKKKILFENMLKRPPKDVDVLMLEGTSIDCETEDARTEAEVEEELVKLFTERKQLIMVACSHSNVDRLTVLYNACLRTGRTLVMIPYTAYILGKLKIVSEKLPRLGMPQIRVYCEQSRNTAKVTSDKRVLAQLRRSKISYPEIEASRGKLVVLDSAKVRERFGQRGYLEGALLVYSTWEGYLKDNEQFWKDHHVPIEMVHTSGHASISELKKLVKAIDPVKVIPIHTKNPKKFRTLFGSKAELLQNGQDYEL